MGPSLVSCSASWVVRFLRLQKQEKLISEYSTKKYIYTLLGPIAFMNMYTYMYIIVYIFILVYKLTLVYYIYT